jgi:hypothetical protein
VEPAAAASERRCSESSEAALEALCLDVEALTSTKEDLHAQLLDKEAKLAEAQREASQLSGVLEWYRADHIRSAGTLRTDILELLGQCNLGAPPTSFPGAPSRHSTNGWMPASTSSP